MLTLHQATEETKQAVKWSAIALCGFIVFLILIRVGLSLKDYFFPKPAPLPTVTFGKLTDIKFPNNASNLHFSYSVDTLTGQIPPVSTLGTVYQIIHPDPNLLALQRAKEKATVNGFVSDPTAITETEYQWADQGELQRILKIDILTLNFNLSSQYLTNSSILSATNLPTTTDAIATAQKFIGNISFPSDIDSDKTTTTLLSITNGGLTAASSIANTQIIRVDFFQKDINNLHIYYPHPPESLVQAYIGGGSFQGQVVTAKKYTQVVGTTSATYPLKTADQAFQELKNNQAYIASYFGSSPTILIKNVSLGYYASDQPQDYLLPIIIFEGNDGFFAYVSAVQNSWITK